MNIVVIFGSPRKKNSFILTEAFERELKKLGDFNFEYFFLNEINLKTCIGCHQCLFRGEENCPLKDDREMLTEKMLTSQGIVFVSPVYVSQVTSLMKNFIDRMAFLCHRPQLYYQHAMVISTTGVMDLKKVLKYLTEVAFMWGIRSATTLGIVTPPDKKKEEIENDKKIEKAARKFYKKLTSQKWSPSINQLIQFRVIKVFLASKVTKDISPKDYQHYTKLKDQSYHIPVKMNFFKHLIGWGMELMVKLFIKIKY
ncbi:MAG: hypothetical protein APR63_01830 [Desulfuromonas sp. SDB]|nr:MAG: hypothetical protein APR63_01830 [Desulfuromonas sp. SDB]